MTRGASKEDLFMELWEPLELNEERPCARLSVKIRELKTTALTFML
jgi:hypothetical protein